METATGVAPPPVTSKPAYDAYDRFKLGWRIRPRLTEEGRLVHDRIPLTSYDILHPQEGDFRVHNHEHMSFCNYLVDVFQSRTANDPHAVVLHDTRLAWDVPALEAHGPDVAVIFGVREVKKWSTFDVKVEGVRPTLIVEVTSPETRRIDLEDKPDEYELAGVDYFIIVDAYIGRQQTAYRLIGRRLTPEEGYIEMTPNAQGWLWLEPLEIWIGFKANQLECYTAEGKRIGDYTEVAEEMNEAVQRAEQERQRAEQQRQRAEQERQEKDSALNEAARLRQKLFALGVDPDSIP
jgi:hypothetical protein